MGKIKSRVGGDELELSHAPDDGVDLHPVRRQAQSVRDEVGVHAHILSHRNQHVRILQAAEPLLPRVTQ